MLVLWPHLTLRLAFVAGLARVRFSMLAPEVWRLQLPQPQNLIYLDKAYFGLPVSGPGSKLLSK